jgi:hypothetical protein
MRNLLRLGEALTDDPHAGKRHGVKLEFGVSTNVAAQN